MNYETSKTLKDTPAEGHALLERVSHHYARTRNGAWIGDGASSQRFEVPLDELNRGDWLNVGRSESLYVKLPSGDALSIGGSNDPIRTYGFGELGYVTFNDRYGAPARELIHRPHPALPNVAPAYHGMRFFSDEVMATFEPLKD